MITFRDATDAERYGYVRSSWLTAILPRRQHLASDGMLRAPRKGHRLSLGFARKALELAVEDLLDDEQVQVIVAEHARVPGEILGWVAFDDVRVHFVRVPAPYANKGLGRSLLARVGELEHGYSTAAGDALARAVSCTKEPAA